MSNDTVQLTREEKKAIDALKKANANWPKSLKVQLTPTDIIVFKMSPDNEFLSTQVDSFANKMTS